MKSGASKGLQKFIGTWAGTLNFSAGDTAGRAHVETVIRPHSEGGLIFETALQQPGQQASRSSSILRMSGEMEGDGIQSGKWSLSGNTIETTFQRETSEGWLEQKSKFVLRSPGQINSTTTAPFIKGTGSLLRQKPQLVPAV